MNMTSNSDCEAQRLAALHEYEVLDTPAEESFDRITRLARMALEAPIALVSFVEESRQWFKSNLGLDAKETARDVSFCTHAIEQDGPFIVRDTLLDPRFRENPMVVGSPHVRFYAGIPLRTPTGFRIGTLCVKDIKPRDVTPEQIAVLQDLAQLVVDELELRKLAAVDSLTGALTKRTFAAAAEKEVARARRFNHALSVIIFDVDHFKAVNDTHGHAAGDLVLSRVVGACRDELRPSDTIGRLGGEEFGLLLPGTSGDGVREAAHRLKAIIEAISIPHATGAFRVTASFGATCWNPADRDASMALARADAALYSAKKAGRNKVVLYEDEAALAAAQASVA
jgi:diguanylate cyclase (GGDEF)-like protein